MYVRLPIESYLSYRVVTILCFAAEIGHADSNAARTYELDSCHTAAVPSPCMGSDASLRSWNDMMLLRRVAVVAGGVQRVLNQVSAGEIK